MLVSVQRVGYRFSTSVPPVEDGHLSTGSLTDSLAVKLTRGEHEQQTGIIIERATNVRLSFSWACPNLHCITFLHHGATSMISLFHTDTYRTAPWPVKYTYRLFDPRCYRTLFEYIVTVQDFPVLNYDTCDDLHPIIKNKNTRYVCPAHRLYSPLKS